ncbi:hypothetical protein CRI93_03625 [Longimonas halophila]|uniref:Uncharacterized protein n=1 Tax=Longimonas halophila TaxID=1469170 RepID=A0A2H3NPG5_9BACT|nr:hypothetical protein [Longimonas halophila]PEN08850.1 hypothetical protein CRI93_03625 [Longimonas halophila]
MTDSSLSGRLANFLSSAFLVLALLVAAGFAVHSMSMTEATAKSDVDLQMDFCSNDLVFPGQCTGQPINCPCSGTIEDGLLEESDS